MSSFSSFAAASNSSITHLQTLGDAATRNGDIYPVQDDVEDAIGRFSVWAENIGSLQPPSSRRSLDYRLRNAPDIRRNIHVALERLAEAAQMILRIMDDEAQDTRDNMQSSTDDSPSTNGFAGASPKDEIRELSHSIKSSIDTLFRLSMLARRHRPKGRLPLSSTDDGDGPPPEDPIDVRHISDLFPTVKDKPWLVKRLAGAMSKRRGYIKYREKHRGLLAHVEEPDAVGEGNDLGDAGTIATTFVDRQEPGSQAKSDSATTFTSATSFVSLIGADGEEGPGQAIPDVTCMVMYNRFLNYDEPFECPLCRTIQNPINRQEWKAHVFADLEPYVCTFENCQLASCLFSSRHDWWRHEMETHRQTWRCTICTGAGGDTKSASSEFKSRRDIEAHIREQHSDTVTESQIGFIVKMCRDPLAVAGSTCPLCPDWPSESVNDEVEGDSAKSLAKHLARHLQQLALASLPISIEGLEFLEPSTTLDDSEVQDSKWWGYTPDELIATSESSGRRPSFFSTALAAARRRDRNRETKKRKNEDDKIVAQALKDLDEREKQKLEAMRERISSISAQRGEDEAHEEEAYLSPEQVESK